MAKIKGLMILNDNARHWIYGPEEMACLNETVDFYASPMNAEALQSDYGVLNDAEVIFSGWGSPVLDERFVEAAGKLKAYFYGAGSIRHITTEAFWKRHITICSAWGANAVPVSEYTLSQILFCLKGGWSHVRRIRRHKRGGYQRGGVAGAYGSTVGLISLGMIARRVCELLRPFDVNVIAYDPFVSSEQAEKLGVTLVGLDEVFQQGDVVSLHTPRLPETIGMITGKHFEQMKPNSAFINTARGAIIRETEMIEVLQRRDDITAVLDVTDPEPPADGSPLYELDNVVLTPHIAGSMEAECRRHARFMIDEFTRYCKGEPLQWAVSQKQAETLA